jgi:hypothetical protein
MSAASSFATTSALVKAEKVFSINATTSARAAVRLLLLS